MLPGSSLSPGIFPCAAFAGALAFSKIVLSLSNVSFVMNCNVSVLVLEMIV